MHQLIKPLPAVNLIPTRQRPLQLNDRTANIYLHMEEHANQLNAIMNGRFRWLSLKEADQEMKIDFDWLSISEISRLAAGEELPTPIGKIKASGRLRMAGGYEDDKLTKLVLEFLPDASVAQGMPFESWLNLRFPELSDCLYKGRDEPWWVLFHAQWAEETRPATTLAPDDGLLHNAVMNNHEHWVEAILQYQPHIKVQPGTEKSIQETVLGIAMENTGMFGEGAGFASGCHRHYRDDDFTQAEDPDTWVPRAERIAERLKAAGAIDYSPLLEACRAGQVDEVEAMLKAGFPANFTIYGHTTALCEAVQPGHDDICDLLLCYGADPNQPRPFETSMTFGGEIYPLTLAIEHPAILKRLLQAGADPNLHRDDLDETPVLFVGGFDSQEHAEEMFELVDFTTIRGKHGRSGVFYLDAKNLDFCQKLIPAEWLNELDNRGTTPLLHAIIYNDAAKAQRLIAMGADPTQAGMIWENQANSMLSVLDTGHILTQYLTPIQTALQIGSFELVEFLFDHGAPATRQSHGLHVPQIESDEEFVRLRDRFQMDIDQLDGGIRLSTCCYGPYFPHDRARQVEILLATLMIHQPAATLKKYAEFIECIDLVAWAEEQGLHPAMIEPFRSGKKLDKAAWMALLDEAIDRLKGATQVFRGALHPLRPGEASCADTSSLLGPLRHAEQALIHATLRITGKLLKPLDLASEACERASGDFKGGTARAHRDAETTGKVGFDDFIEALAEHFSSGSTMDHGKLLQAVQLITTRLIKRSEKLRKLL